MDIEEIIILIFVKTTEKLLIKISPIYVSEFLLLFFESANLQLLILFPIQQLLNFFI